MESLFGSAASHAICWRGVRGTRTGSASLPGAAGGCGSGWAVSFTDLICGGRLGIWYATVTSSITGVALPSAPLVNVSRYWRNRALGDPTCTNSAAPAASLHFDQLDCVASFTFPLRVATLSDVPAGRVPWSCNLPNRLI